VASIEARVSLDPVPAMTGTRLPRSAATATAISMQRSRSSWLSVGDSPVVPTGTRPSIPDRPAHDETAVGGLVQGASAVNG